MVQNIAIISFKKNQAYEVSKLLAEQLDMSFLDTVELFEFDNAPRTQTDMIRDFGLKTYRKSICSTVKYASFFENTVINIDPSALSSQKIFDIIKNNCLLIYIGNGTKRVHGFLQKQKYASKELEKIYKLSLEKIQKTDEKIRKNADIVVGAVGPHDLKLVSEILRHIKDFYGVR